MTTPAPDRPLRGTRLSWHEFYQLTGREPPKAANDDQKADDRQAA